MSRSLFWTLLSLCAVVSNPASSAEEQTPEEQQAPVTLEPITVTATPLDQDELHIAQPVTVLRGDELRRRQSLTIGETLSRERGISASDFGLGASRPIIRGLGGSRVRILEGGVGSMDVSNLGPDHAVSIDPFQASQIEILKGPSTLLYGSGAIGGIVNIVTNRIPTEVPEQPSVQADFRFDSATNERTGGRRYRERGRRRLLRGGTGLPGLFRGPLCQQLRYPRGWGRGRGEDRPRSAPL